MVDDYELVDGFWLPRFVQSESGVWLRRETAEQMAADKKLNDLFQWFRHPDSPGGMDRTLRMLQLSRILAPGLLEADVLAEAESILGSSSG